MHAQVLLAATELELDGAAPDAAARHQRVLRGISECKRILASQSEPDQRIVLRLYWLRVRFETVAGDPEVACRYVVSCSVCCSRLRTHSVFARTQYSALGQFCDHLRASDPTFELALPYLQEPWNFISMDSAELLLRRTTDQNQVAIAENALQTGAWKKKKKKLYDDSSCLLLLLHARACSSPFSRSHG